jgi:cell division protein FtsX
MSNYLLIRGEKAIIDTLHVKDLTILGPNNIILYIYAGIVVLGGLIGILSSGFALKRYIRV